ncbi:hypothetical protein T4B_12473 [Trichinella pseudospiralis]|uniref:Uncharacterized protein n=1 Tax=Trichinella pseudospiralis TaxID=6337 RepID=A0A0V1H6H3_TRIPS|nr:hypothetical protein T4B_12473 [Trichinella pseudospiralis]
MISRPGMTRDCIIATLQNFSNLSISDLRDGAYGSYHVFSTGGLLPDWEWHQENNHLTVQQERDLQTIKPTNDGRRVSNLEFRYHQEKAFPGSAMSTSWDSVFFPTL